MRTTSLRLILLFTFLTAALQVNAASAANATSPNLAPAEKAQLQKWQAYISDPKGPYAYYPVEMCGRAIPVNLDSSLVAPFMKAGNDAAVYCESIRTKLSTMCRNSVDLNNNNKAKINKLVKSITCKIAASPDEASYKLVKGELQASLGAKASNIEEKLLEFLDATPE